MIAYNANMIMVIEVVVLIFLQFVKLHHVANVKANTHSKNEVTGKTRRSSKAIFCEKKLSVLAQTFYVAFVAYSNLQTSMIYSTERDLYYRQPWLFQHSGKQRGVHNAINRLCMWLHNAHALVSETKRGKISNNNHVLPSLVHLYKFFFQSSTFTSNSCDVVSVTDSEHDVCRETKCEGTSKFTFCKVDDTRNSDNYQSLTRNETHKGALDRKTRLPHFSPLFTREMLHLSSSPKTTIVGNLIFDVQHKFLDNQQKRNVVEVEHTISCAGEGILLTMAVAESACHFREVNENDNVLQPCNERVNRKYVADETNSFSKAATTMTEWTSNASNSRNALVLIEKECILRELVHKYTERNTERMNVNSVLATSTAHDDNTSLHDLFNSLNYTFMCCRGYPCIASRIFLQRIHQERPDIPLLALVDGDVHGINILLTYMGLRGQHIMQRSTIREETNHLLQHDTEIITTDMEARLENSYLLSLLPIQYVGLTPSQLTLYQQEHTMIKQNNQVYSHVNRDVNVENKSSSHLIPLTEHDAKLLLTLLTFVNNAIYDIDAMRARCLSAMQEVNKVTANTAISPTVQNMIDISYHKNQQINDLTIVSFTLHRVKKELEWMQRTQQKCELESINAETLLNLLDQRSTDINGQSERSKRPRGMETIKSKLKAKTFTYLEDYNKYCKL